METTHTRPELPEGTPTAQEAEWEINHRRERHVKEKLARRREAEREGRKGSFPSERGKIIDTLKRNQQTPETQDRTREMSFKRKCQEKSEGTSPGWAPSASGPLPEPLTPCGTLRGRPCPSQSERTGLGKSADVPKATQRTPKLGRGASDFITGRRPLLHRCFVQN